MKNVHAVYPGTFDPITNGHLDILERASAIFEKVYVLVAVNPAKNPLFSLEERIDLILCTINHLKNVEVKSFDGLVVDFARQHKCRIIIRGLRAVTDFEYELQMAMMNKKLNPDVDTIFLTPNEKFSYLTSSIVRQVASFGGDVQNFVPDCVLKKLLDKVSSRMKK